MSQPTSSPLLVSQLTSVGRDNACASLRSMTGLQFAPAASRQGGPSDMLVSTEKVPVDSNLYIMLSKMNAAGDLLARHKGCSPADGKWAGAEDDFCVVVDRVSPRIAGSLVQPRPTIHRPGMRF